MLARIIIISDGSGSRSGPGTGSSLADYLVFALGAASYGADYSSFSGILDSGSKSGEDAGLDAERTGDAAGS